MEPRRDRPATEPAGTPAEADETGRFELLEVRNLAELPGWADLPRLIDFLHHRMKPYQDLPADVERGLRYALDPERPGDGFCVLAARDGRLAGAVVFLETGMRGYIPENLLLFACVEPGLRGQGLGARLIARALGLCRGDVKLHVEYDNPARRLYERLGFRSNYAEMRLKTGGHG